MSFCWDSNGIELSKLNSNYIEIDWVSQAIQQKPDIPHQKHWLVFDNDVTFRREDGIRELFQRGADVDEIRNDAVHQGTLDLILELVQLLRQQPVINGINNVHILKSKRRENSDNIVIYKR